MDVQEVWPPAAVGAFRLSTQTVRHARQPVRHVLGPVPSPYQCRAQFRVPRPPATVVRPSEEHPRPPTRPAPGPPDSSDADAVPAVRRYTQGTVHPFPTPPQPADWHPVATDAHPAALHPADLKPPSTPPAAHRLAPAAGHPADPVSAVRPGRPSTRVGQPREDPFLSPRNPLGDRRLSWGRTFLGGVEPSQVDVREGKEPRAPNKGSVGARVLGVRPLSPVNA